MNRWIDVFSNAFVELKKDETFHDFFITESENDFTISFGDKSSYSFTMYFISNYIIVSQNKFQTPPELLSKIAELLIKDLNDYQIPSILSCGEIYNTHEKTNEIASVFKYILQNMPRNDIRVPGYSVIPSLSYTYAIHILYENKHLIASIKDMESAKLFIENDDNDLQKMNLANSTIHDYILSLDSEVTIIKNSYSTTPLYYKPDIFALGFDFKKSFDSEMNCIYKSSYHLDNERYNLQNNSLDQLILDTMTHIKEYLLPLYATE